MRQAMVENIGHGGALITIPRGEDIYCGEEVALEIPLPVSESFTPKSIYCRGRVVRIEAGMLTEMRIAVQFQQVSFAASRAGAMPAGAVV